MEHETQETLPECIARLRLTVSAKFVPFSRSRNAKNGHRSLNWEVTLQREGADILTTDYSAGIGHCPAYKAPVSRLGNMNSILRARFIEWETENGKVSHTNEHRSPFGMEPILPNATDVIYSLARDADVIEYRSFEEWAESIGYDTDSRKALETYRACLDIALRLRGSLGESAFSALVAAANEY